MRTSGKGLLCPAVPSSGPLGPVPPQGTTAPGRSDPCHVPLGRARCRRKPRWNSLGLAPPSHGRSHGEPRSAAVLGGSFQGRGSGLVRGLFRLHQPGRFSRGNRVARAVHRIPGGRRSFIRSVRRRTGGPAIPRRSASSASIARAYPCRRQSRRSSRPWTSF